MGGSAPPGVTVLRNLEMREVRDMLEGCALLSTGGGGDPARGWEMVRREYEAGHSFLLASLEELPDDASTCSVYFTGSTEIGRAHV